MAEISGFFNAYEIQNDDGSVGYDRTYLAQDFAEYFNIFVSNGVSMQTNEKEESDQLQVFFDTGRQIRLNDGKAWINGYSYYLNEDMYFLVSPADGVLSRKDAIVLEWSLSKRSITARLQEGVLAVNPVVYQPIRTTETYELVLASITVSAGSINVSQADIEDTRGFDNLCGWIHSLLEQVDTTTIFEQFRALVEKYEGDFEELFDKMQKAMEEVLAGNVPDSSITLPKLASSVYDFFSTKIANHTNYSSNKHTLETSVSFTSTVFGLMFMAKYNFKIGDAITYDGIDYVCYQGENIANTGFTINEVVTINFDKTNKKCYLSANETVDGSITLDKLSSDLVLPITKGGTGNTVGRAVTANTLTTARTIRVNLASTTNVTFNGSANVNISVNGVLPTTNGGTGNTNGTIATLITARTIRTNLSSTSSASFNGSSNITPGVTGILPITNGGTGGNTVATALTNLTAITNIALGTNTVATGTNSTGLGRNATASGDYSTALGGYSNATATSTTAVGMFSKATGNYSAALGSSSNASGVNSISIGFVSNATASESVAIGYYSNASGLTSISLGSTTTASGSMSVALGYNSKAIGNYSISLGYGTNSSGCSAVTLGYGANSSGNYAISLGRSSKATANYSVALGGSSGAVGMYSTALGSSANASGISSTALGYDSTASGNNSIAIGHTATASGNYSTSIGMYSIVSGVYSTTLGHGALCHVNYSTAIGYQAVASSNPNTIQLGNATSLSVLSCRVNLTATSDERDKIDIEDTTKSLEFLEKIRTVTYKFNHRDLYHSDADIDIKDTELDENDEPIPVVLSANDERKRKIKEKRIKFGVYDYDKVEHSKGSKKGSRGRVGVLAKQVQQAMIEVYGDDNYADLITDSMYNTDPNEIEDGMENILGVNSSGFIPFLIDAIKELNTRVKELEGKQ